MINFTEWLSIKIISTLIPIVSSEKMVNHVIFYWGRSVLTLNVVKGWPTDVIKITFLFNNVDVERLADDKLVKHDT